jgi:hypothetical protein
MDYWPQSRPLGLFQTAWAINLVNRLKNVKMKNLKKRIWGVVDDGAAAPHILA